MVISSYQIDNVIKAYNKQQKSRVRLDVNQDPVKDRQADVVSLSGNNNIGKETYNKISYNLVDILMKQKG